MIRNAEGRLVQMRDLIVEIGKKVMEECRELPGLKIRKYVVACIGFQDK